MLYLIAYNFLLDQKSYCELNYPFFKYDLSSGNATKTAKNKDFSHRYFLKLPNRNAVGVAKIRKKTTDFATFISVTQI